MVVDKKFWVSVAWLSWRVPSVSVTGTAISSGAFILFCTLQRILSLSITLTVFHVYVDVLVYRNNDQSKIVSNVRKGRP